jgi:hypothetical protein
MAQTLAEIARIDPSFDKEEFLIHCERKVGIHLARLTKARGLFGC